MSTMAEIPCVADLQSRTLADAISKVCGDSILVVRGGRDRRRSRPAPLVSFEEATAEGCPIPEAYRAGIAYALVLAPKPGDYPMPSGVSEVLTANTATQLGRAVLRKIRELRQTAEQRIAFLDSDRREMEVTFLDGERFRLAADRSHDWKRVMVSSDRRFLMVPRARGELLDTIPWDAIRKPRSHLDEAERTKRRLARTLRRLRTEAGLSQAEAARRGGLTRKTINRLENAGNYPGVATLEALARAYGTSLPDLLASLRTAG